MKKLLKYGLVIGVVILLLFAYGYRYYQLNQKFPKAVKISCEMGDSLSYRGGLVTINQWKLATPADIREIYPEFMTDKDPVNAPAPEDQLKILLVTVTVTNESNEDIVVPLYTASAVSGTWSNGIDQFLFQSINSPDASLSCQVATGESQIVILPYKIASSMMLHNDWIDVGNLPYEVILETYPQKIIFNLQ
ncbi:MAG: hypothetical protein PHH84_06850 [Oscillospiraceae bacterium]|nr:hypothetical protein [Oscillospiraceae bacterium]MDD4414476.1 hypothetical protein [Oscillospiraceae bacterium]